MRVIIRQKDSLVQGVQGIPYREEVVKEGKKPPGDVHGDHHWKKHSTATKKFSGQPAAKHAAQSLRNDSLITSPPLASISLAETDATCPASAIMMKVTLAGLQVHHYSGCRL